MSRVFWSTKDPRRRCVYTCRITEVIPEVYSTPDVAPDVTVCHDSTKPDFDMSLHLKYTTKQSQGNVNKSTARKMSSAVSDDSRLFSSTVTDDSRYTSSISDNTRRFSSLSDSRVDSSSAFATDDSSRYMTSPPLSEQRLRVAGSVAASAANKSSNSYTPPTAVWSSLDALTKQPPKRNVSDNMTSNMKRKLAVETPADKHLLKMVERLNRAASLNRSRSSSRERSNSREGTSRQLFGR